MTPMTQHSLLFAPCAYRFVLGASPARAQTGTTNYDKLRQNRTNYDKLTARKAVEWETGGDDPADALRYLVATKSNTCRVVRLTGW